MNPCPHWVYRAPPAAWARVGRWVSYTAAEVARRRAARMVLIVACAGGIGAGGYQATEQMPPAWLGLPKPLPAIHAPVPVWRGLPPLTERAPMPVHAVPEPGTAALLGMALVGLLFALRKRGGRPSLFICEPAPGGSPVNEETTWTSNPASQSSTFSPAVAR